MSSAVTLPADVVGVIAAFLCEKPSDAATLMLVSGAWHQGVTSSEPMWLALTRAKWPNTRARAASYSSMKARVLAAAALKPARATDLHPIEDCTLEFTCPKFSALLTVDEAATAANGGRTVFSCGVCRDHVYLVSTADEMALCGIERRCVIVDPRVIAANSKLGEAHILVIDNDGGASARALLLALRVAVGNDKVATWSFSDALDGMVASRPSGAIAVQFHIRAVKPGSAASLHVAREDTATRRCSVVVLASADILSPVFHDDRSREVVEFSEFGNIAVPSEGGARLAARVNDIFPPPPPPPPISIPTPFLVPPVMVRGLPPPEPWRLAKR